GERATMKQAAQDPDWRGPAAPPPAPPQLGGGGAPPGVGGGPDPAHPAAVPALARGPGPRRHPRPGHHPLEQPRPPAPGRGATAARLLAGRRVSGAVDNLVAGYAASRQDDIVAAKFAILQALKGESANEKAMNILKQGVMDKDWLVKKRAYAILEDLGAAQGI